MHIRPHVLTVVVAVASLVGLLFASVSTFDFAMHLDREVHDVHCSFAPGLAGVERGESGCQVALVSSYSSIFRSHVWGGVPISLPAMGVFAFLLFFAVELVLGKRQRDVRATALLALATAVPALTSIVMAYIAVVELEAVCRLCIGIYLASALALFGGVGLWLRARKRAAEGGSDYVLLEKRTETPAARVERPDPDADDAARADPPWANGNAARSEPNDGADGEAAAEAADDERPSDSQVAAAIDAALATPVSGTHRLPARAGGASPRYLAALVGVGLLFVATPVTAYLLAAPDHSRFIGACGSLAHPEAESDVLVPIDAHAGAPPAIIVLDPLCPACRAFEQRLGEDGFAGAMDRRALLFPLDNSCNWMVDSALHPGACVVSEAVLCANADAPEVVAWAFANQERIREAAAADDKAAARMVREAFPRLAGCVGSPEARSRLNRSLRWAVSNQLPIMAPQLFVGGVKLCSEDVDLGLEFALGRMLSAYREGRLRAEAVGTEVDTPEPARSTPTEPQPTAPTTPPASTEPTAPTTPPASTEPTAPATPPAPPSGDPAPTTPPAPPSGDPAPTAPPAPPLSPADDGSSKAAPTAEPKEDAP